MNFFRLSSVTLKLAGLAVSYLAVVPQIHAAALLSGEPDEIGPHVRSWKVTKENAASTLANSNVARVVEIATGMNFWDGERYLPSDPTFDLAEKGFVANRVQHPVFVSANINQIGAVKLTTPDGIHLSSTPVGIGLYDAKSGKSVIIGKIENTPGVLVGKNQIVFENAFSGVGADVIYRLENGTFEQDIRVNAPINAADYGFPEETTQIQIFTEFYGAPRPEKVRHPLYVEKNQTVRKQMVTPDKIDETIGFGEFVIGVGKAFIPSSKLFPRGSSSMVSKQFATIDDRTVLIESLDYKSVRKALKALPQRQIRQAALSKRTNARIAKIPKAGTDKVDILPRRAEKKMASLADKSRGVTIDYVGHIGGTLTGTTIFQSDHTYLVTGNVYCNGPTIIEGGTVLKYKAGTSVTVGGALTMKTSSYRPAIFTAMDDDTVGDSAAGYTLATTGYTGTIDSGDYASPALQLYSGSPSLSYLRFSHAQVAINCYSTGYPVFEINHSQFLSCLRGIYLGVFGSNGSGVALSVNNCLFSEVEAVIADNCDYIDTYTYLTQCTIDGCSLVTRDGSQTYDSPHYLNLFNSIISRSGGLLGMGCGAYFDGDYNGFYSSFGGSTFGDHPIVTSTFPFQTSGANNYYLNTASSFVNAGSQSAASAGLYHFTTATSQAKEASSTVDLGFHYLSVDANGLPLDSDGDGIPDYLEDTSGDGTQTPGESNWLNPLGFQVFITKPQTNSLLP